MRRALAGIVAFAFLMGAAPTASTDQRVFVTLRVDAVEQGEAVAVLDGKDVWLPVGAIENAGVHGFGGTRRTVYGKLYVSLASLAPNITFAFDEDALTLDVDVAAALLPRADYDLRNENRPPNLEYVGDDSGFINYSLDASRGGSSSGFAEGGYSMPGGLLYSSLTVESGAAARRGLTYFEADDRTSAIRRTYGDALVSTGDLGGSSFLAGISVSRAFDLDPYAIHFPQPTLTGAVTSPSTADVYVNGVLTNRIQLPPGTFDLNRIPVANGSALTTVVVIDAFGRSQTYQQGYYSNTSLLDPGTSDFEFGAGVLRNAAFAANEHYGGMAAMGRYRIGLTDRATGGFRFEFAPQLMSYGPSLDVVTGVGFLHFGAAVSSDGGLTGAAYSAAYGYLGRRFSVGISATGETAYYATTSQPADLDRTVSSLSAYATASLGRRSSLSLQFLRRIDRDGGASAQAALSDTIALGRDLSLTLTGERGTSATDAPSSSFTASLNIAMGRRDAVVSTTTSDQGADTALQIQQNPPGIFGLDYVASIDRSSTTVSNATFDYRSRYGDYGLDYTHDAEDQAGYDLRASGGLAFIGGGLYPTRPIDESYALVDLPGLSGVHVYLENQDVGTTDARGKLLVPGLTAYYGNQLRISDAGAPMDASVQTLARTIAPPERGGAVVTFPVRRVRALVGKLIVLLDGKRVVPKYGDLSVDGSGVHVESAIGDDGEFYLEDVPSGTYSATITYAKGSCTFALREPEGEGALANLGTLECTAS